LQLNSCKKTKKQICSLIAQELQKTKKQLQLHYCLSGTIEEIHFISQYLTAS
jgi:hypothetical protein